MKLCVCVPFVLRFFWLEMLWFSGWGTYACLQKIYFCFKEYLYKYMYSYICIFFLLYIFLFKKSLLRNMIALIIFFYYETNVISFASYSKGNGLIPTKDMKKWLHFNEKFAMGWNLHKNNFPIFCNCQFLRYDRPCTQTSLKIDQIIEFCLDVSHD